MLHPYSIFFKAMWETPPTARDDAVPERTHRMRWRLWWTYAASRRAAAERTTATTPVQPTPTKAPGGGMAG